MQQIDLIRDCCNKHPTSDIMNHRVDVKTLTWLAGQTHNMLELIDYQAAAWLRDHEQDIAGKLCQLPRPEGRGLRLRKKSCRVRVADSSC